MITTVRRILAISWIGIAGIVTALIVVDPLKAKQWAWVVELVGPVWTIWLFRGLGILYIAFGVIAAWRGWFRGPKSICRPHTKQ